MYSNIQDCDEGEWAHYGIPFPVRPQFLNTFLLHAVYNFWEPLHYLDRGVGFQTWEVSPQYAIRSWAYISLHLMPAWAPRLLHLEKASSFTKDMHITNVHWYRDNPSLPFVYSWPL